jgi:hypothetical protein
MLFARSGSARRRYLVTRRAGTAVSYRIPMVTHNQHGSDPTARRTLSEVDLAANKHKIEGHDESHRPRLPQGLACQADRVHPKTLVRCG